MPESTRRSHFAPSISAVAGTMDYVERRSEGSPNRRHSQLPVERPPDSIYQHQAHLSTGVAAVAGVYPLNHRAAERIRPHPEVPAERSTKGYAPSKER